jgi:succinate dehydrogenase / fumarate reductase cytochrome b subunit
VKSRPLSPFMIGPYYRPQLTSVLSILHRATGVFLCLVGTPLVLWWLAALSAGEQAYQSAADCLSGVTGSLLAVACLFSLSFHFFNGIRHLVWDSGRWLDIKSAYLSGWLVLASSLVSTAILFGAMT